MAGRLFVFAIVSAVAMVSISAVGSAANFRAMMEQDVKEIEKRLKLAGDKLAEVNKILTKAVERRMAILREHKVTPGVRPPISTLITVKSEMDRIRTENHRELMKILSEPEMQIVEEMSERMRAKIRSIILGE